MAENKTQKPAREYTNFERLVIEYIAFNDGFINTRLRARRMLDEIAADAPPLGEPKGMMEEQRNALMRSYFETIAKYLEADLPGLALNTAEKARALLTKGE